MNTTVVAMLALLVGGCSKPSDKPAPAPPAPSAIVQVTAAPAPATTPSAFFHTRISYAHQAADECMQVQLPTAEALAAFEKDAPVPQGTTVQHKECSDVFTDRLPLARCVVHKGPIEIKEFYFQISHDDAMMKECLDAKGDWTAVSHTSPEYRRAELEEVHHTLAEVTR